MGVCPFLSSYEEKVLCFEECSFYNWTEFNECPFRKLNGGKTSKKGIAFDYDAFAVEESDPEEEDFI